jgi:ATP-dependent DNA helicase RecG
MTKRHPRADSIGAEIEAISAAWLKEKNVKEKKFSLGYFDRDYLSNFDVGVVRKEGKIVAFCNLWDTGTKEELRVDLMRYAEDSPHGIMDFLFASLMLYGKQFLPHYPQCLLKMGRFRGTKITGEIVDNRQEYMNAFAMIREGMAFLERTMPLGARFPTGQIFREDRFPVPLDALREILLNAVMHRDYSHYSGYVAIVVFDDRIEIRSYGCLPSGITVKKLSGKHDSKPVNPLIAGAFHRTGAVEVWGRGTNRVIEMCRQHGAALPVFEETQGFVHVTFKAPMVPALGEEANRTPQLESQLESLPSAVLRALTQGCLSKAELAVALKQKQASGQLHVVIRHLLEDRQIERTIPDKPNSRLQKYRLTPRGKARLAH